MKTKLAALTFVVALACGPAWSWGQASFPEPEFVGQVVGRQGEASEPLTLERQTTQSRATVRALGFGGGSAIAYWNGAHSPVRMAQGEQARFYVRLPADGSDPAANVNLYRITTNGQRREIELARVNPLGIGMRTNSGDFLVPLTASRYGTGSAVLTPTTPLPPGEYVVGFKDGNTGYLFGVD